jgi:hypothetical protein
MQSLILATATGGAPNGIVVNQPDADGANVNAWARCGGLVGPQTGIEYGCYIVSGSSEQLAAVAVLESVYICDALDWQAAMLPGSLAVLNGLLAALNVELPSGTTYQQAMAALFSDFDPGGYSVAEDVNE